MESYGLIAVSGVLATFDISYRNDRNQVAAIVAIGGIPR